MHTSSSLWLAVLCQAALVAAENDWDDITNNLFTDLAPILALFGERVTMQFMSQAISWEDCVMLAFAPLGILTIIVSAIRVGGPMWLKAVVGRARENIAAAEMELMSSTSRDVCELNNGNGIVRCQGTAPVWEFICLLPQEKSRRKGTDDAPYTFEYMTLDEALQKGRIVRKRRRDMFNLNKQGTIYETRRYSTEYLSDKDPEPAVSSSQESGAKGGWMRNRFARSRLSDLESAFSKLRTKSAARIGLVRQPSQPGSLPHTRPTSTWEQPPDDVITIIHDAQSEAPNISLNLQGSSHRGEIKAFAIFGIFLQLGVLAFFTAMTFHPTFKWKFDRDEELAPVYAYPLALVGTVVLVLGLLVCAHVVENSTKEKHYALPDGGRRIHFYWLQQQQVVNDQTFESIATRPASPRSTITTSRRRQDREGRFGLETETLIGTSIALLGFVVQFVGFRGMHSAASTSQLVAVGIMTLLRAWLRRGLARTAEQTRLVPNHELDWLAMELQRLSEQKGTSTDPQGDPAVGTWNLDYSNVDWSPRDRGQQRASMRSSTGPLSPQDLTRHSFHILRQSDEPSQSRESSAQCVLNLRRGLGNLAKTRSTTVADAIRLADAINQSQQILSQSVDGGKSNDLPSHNWKLRIAYKPLHELSERSECVEISSDNPKYRRGVTTELADAILSLWLYSVRQQHPSRSSQNEVRRGAEMDATTYDSWLRGALIPSGLLIVAELPERAMWPLLHDMMWWAPNEVEGLLKVQPDVSGAEISGSTPRGLKPSAKKKHNFGSHIVGLSGRIHAAARSHLMKSRIFRRRTQWTETVEVKTDLQTFQAGEGEALITNSLQQDVNINLGLTSNQMLETLYAKKLLFDYIKSSSQRLPTCLPGDIEVQQITSKEGRLSTPRLTHPIVTKLAEVVVQASYGTDQEAFLALVASLWCSDVLPSPNLAHLLPPTTNRKTNLPGGLPERPERAMFDYASQLRPFFMAILSHIHGKQYMLSKGVALMVDIMSLVELEQEVNKRLYPSSRQAPNHPHEYLPSSFFTELLKPSRLRDTIKVVTRMYHNQQRRLPSILSMHMNNKAEMMPVPPAAGSLIVPSSTMDHSKSSSINEPRPPSDNTHDRSIGPTTSANLVHSLPREDSQLRIDRLSHNPQTKPTARPPPTHNVAFANAESYLRDSSQKSGFTTPKEKRLGRKDRQEHESRRPKLHRRRHTATDDHSVPDPAQSAIHEIRRQEESGQRVKAGRHRSRSVSVGSSVAEPSEVDEWQDWTPSPALRQGLEHGSVGPRITIEGTNPLTSRENEWSDVDSLRSTFFDDLKSRKESGPAIVLNEKFTLHSPLGECEDDLDLETIPPRYGQESADICHWSQWHYAVTSVTEFRSRQWPEEKYVEVQDYRGYTPLHYAVEQGRERKVKQLLNHGCSQKTQALDGVTPVHIAAKIGEMSLVETLLQPLATAERQIALEIPDCRGWLPVHWAIFGDNLELAHFLIRSTEMSQDDLLKALDLAAVLGKLELLDGKISSQLGEVLCAERSLNLACGRKDWTLVRNLLSNDRQSLRPRKFQPVRLIDIIPTGIPSDVLLPLMLLTIEAREWRSHEEWTNPMKKAVLKATELREPDILRIMLASMGTRGSILRQIFDTQKRSSPDTSGDHTREDEARRARGLMDRSHFDAEPASLDSSEPRTAGADDKSPLVLAARLVRLEHVKLLLSAGADANGKDNNGQSAMQALGSSYATRKDEDAVLSIAQALVEKGADLDEENNMPPKSLARLPQVWQYLLDARKGQKPVVKDVENMDEFAKPLDNTATKTPQFVLQIDDFSNNAS